MGIAKNTMLTLGTDVLVFGLGIAVSVVLARSLGPEGRGVYVLLTTSNVLLANLAHLGVWSACSTLLARGRYRLGEVHAVAGALALLLGLGCAGVVSLLYPWLGGTLFANVPYTYLLIALLLIPTTIYQIYWSSMMMGLNRMGTLNRWNLAINAANALAMIGVVGVLRAGLPGFLAVWASSALVGATGALVLAARMDRLAWPPPQAALREMLQFGLRGHGANIAHHLFLRFDAYVVNVLVGTAGLGIYTLSTSLAEKLWLALNAIYAASLGSIASLPRSESALLTAKVARTSLGLMAALAVPFALVSPWLVPALYGAAFAEAVLPLVILLGGTLAFAVMMVLNNYITGQMQRPGLLSILSWLELAVSLPLYLGLIAWQGIIGAAIASTLTYGLALACTLAVFRRDTGLPLSAVLVPRLSDLSGYSGRVWGALRRVRVPGR